jgi:hypothetical protein
MVEWLKSEKNILRATSRERGSWTGVDDETKMKISILWHF